MATPQSTKYAVIGAGIHGLSTAFHLAQMLKASGRGSGEDIFVVDKTDVAAGASGIACGVVRNNYFQPAMRAADGAFRRGLGERPGGLQLPSRRLHADQPGSDARAGRHDLRAAEGDRLSVDLHRGRRRLDEIHARPLRRLAGAGHHLGAAREEGRLRQQPRQHARPRRQGAERRRAHRGRHRSARLQVRLEQQCRRGA